MEVGQAVAAALLTNSPFMNCTDTRHASLNNTTTVDSHNPNGVHRKPDRSGMQVYGTLEAYPIAAAGYIGLGS